MAFQKWNEDLRSCRNRLLAIYCTQNFCLCAHLNSYILECLPGVCRYKYTSSVLFSSRSPFLLFQINFSAAATDLIQDFVPFTCIHPPLQFLHLERSKRTSSLRKKQIKYTLLSFVPPYLPAEIIRNLIAI